MRSGLARSASISASACCLAAGQGEGQGGEDLRREAAVADARAVPALLRWRCAHQRERELAGEQLVIGEARELRAVGLEVDRLRRVVGARRARRRRPASCSRAISAGSSHSGSAGRLASASPMARASILRAEAGGQRIDRLDQRQAGEIGLGDDVVGMDHASAGR